MRGDSFAHETRCAGVGNWVMSRPISAMMTCAAYPELLEHLGTLTRNKMRVVATEPGIEFDLLATPTPTQRRVFELLGAPVPKRLM